MKKSGFIIGVIIAILIGVAALPVFAANVLSQPTANISGDTVTCNFSVSSSSGADTEATLLAVVKSALVDGDLPDAGALDETNVVYIDQKKVIANEVSAFSFKVAEEFKSEPMRIFVGAADAGKVYVDINDGAAGATVSGVIQSFDPKNITTIMLMTGETVKYETVIGREEGSNQRDQTFSISGVLPGEYTLVIKKDGHLKFTVNRVIIGEANFSLQDDSRLPSDKITLLCGDVNKDGQVNSRDLSILIDNYNKSNSGIIDPLSDLNGDGQINSRDLSLVIDNYNKSNVVIP